MFFWNSFAFSKIQQILAIWSLVLLPLQKPNLYIWKFLVHVLLKAILKDFGHNLASPWNQFCWLNFAYGGLIHVFCDSGFWVHTWHAMYMKWMKVRWFNWATFLLEWWASTPTNVSSQLNAVVIWPQCLLSAIQKENVRKSWQNRCYFSFFDLYFIAGLGKKRDWPVVRVASQGLLWYVKYVDKPLIVFNKGQWSALEYLLLELE